MTENVNCHGKKRLATTKNVDSPEKPGASGVKEKVCPAGKRGKEGR